MYIRLPVIFLVVLLSFLTGWLGQYSALRSDTLMRTATFAINVCEQIDWSAPSCVKLRDQIESGQPIGILQ